MTKLGLHLNINHLNVLLPIGISFYTFHGLSYLIDIYNQKIKPEKNIVDYALFVTFFPLLVAGPIERATHLLPQLKQQRTFNYEFAVDGLRQILWGFFKKIVIADQCAFFADMIFNNSSQYNGISHVFGAFFFAFQIYGDFSGYSDIALGTAKLFGIQLLRNFNYPYFSRNIAEFWRRWHISLSSWFRDYLYIPIGGSKGSYWIRIRNVLVIFSISGLWHGANWTFVIWGLLNAVFIIPSILISGKDKPVYYKISSKFLARIIDFLSMLFTFILTTFAWIFFRSTSVSHAIEFLHEIVDSSMFTAPNFDSLNRAFLVFILILFLLIVEWMNRDREHVFTDFSIRFSRFFRWLIYSLLMFVIGMYMRTEETPFIYFQF
jgi:D-alanyl-lipoteichoic acid acyltransferase DltB (MBOAT superfamily)